MSRERSEHLDQLTSDIAEDLRLLANVLDAMRDRVQHRQEHLQFLAAVKLVEEAFDATPVVRDLDADAV